MLRRVFDMNSYMDQLNKWAAMYDQAQDDGVFDNAEHLPKREPTELFPDLEPLEAEPLETQRDAPSMFGLQQGQDSAMGADYWNQVYGLSDRDTTPTTSDIVPTTSEIAPQGEALLQEHCGKPGCPAIKPKKRGKKRMAEDFWQFLENMPDYTAFGTPMTSKVSDPAAEKYADMRREIGKVQFVLASQELMPKFRQELKKHLEALQEKQRLLHDQLAA